MKFPRSAAPEIDPLKQHIDFQVLDWYIPESDRSKQALQRKYGWDYGAPEGGEKETPVYDICMFGTTAEGHSVYAEVVGFCPYFFVRMPEKWWKGKSEANIKAKITELKQSLIYEKVVRKRYNRSTRQWDEYQATVIPWRLREHMSYMKLVWRKDFWGFTNGEDFPFIKVRVKSLALFNVLKRYFTDMAQEDDKINKPQAERFALYESNIDPFLRFIHERNIQPCGWVRLPKGGYDIIEEDENGAVARTSYMVRVDYNLVESLSINKIAPLLIAGFDIECTSSHGDFPVAKKDYKKLAADLVALRRRRNFTPEKCKEMILDAYEHEIREGYDVLVHQLYPKEKVSRKKLDARLHDDLMDTLMEMLQKAATEQGAFDDDSDEENPAPAIKSKAGEMELSAFLTKHLPPLAGDALIQIGTTVHRYGSDEILYRHIISLGSCDEIDGAEVEMYDTEEEVILAWRDFMQRLDPDILTGYNIFGFDMEYIWVRAEELGVDETLAVGLGRLNHRRCVLDERKLSSSALGDNIMKCFDMDGVVSIDMLKVMQRDHKLDSYKLDSVASIFLGDNKNDLKPHEIFEKFRGDSADRCEIARYCLQDCALVNRLIHKLKVLENNVGMGNVCSVPLSFLFMRGQGIKIFSLVAKECRAKQYLIPVLKGFRDMDTGDQEGYEGAIVLPPQEGIYLDDPITVLDYSSLYPSSMIARNLSHDCFVHDEQYANLQDQGITYLTVEYDVYEGEGDKKKVVGKKNCTFAQLPEGKKGIIPSILSKLLTQRKNTRKKIEYERLELSDGRVAMGLVKEIDGGNKLEIVNVDEADLGAGFGGHKATIDASLVTKREIAFTSFEQAVLDALQLAYKITANSLYGQIGSRTSPIYWKDIAACTTATGREMIMLAKNFAEKEYGAEIVYGDSVTGDTPVIVKTMDDQVYIKTMQSLCNDWIEYENFRPWDTSRKEKEQSGFEGYVWSSGKWARILRVIRHKVNKKIYRVNTAQGCVDVTEDHSLIGKDGHDVKPMDCVIGVTEIMHCFPEHFQEHPLAITEEGAKNMGATFAKGTDEVPNGILNAPRHVQCAFVEGASVQGTNTMAWTYHGKLRAMGMYYLLRATGHISLQVYNDPNHPDTYIIRRTQHVHDKVTCVMEMPRAVEDGEYVYDIETSEGRFQAGVGSIICSNTDSVFIKFANYNEKGERVYGKDALPLAIQAGQRMSKEIKKFMPPPQSLEYEKTFYPFILFSKKRYVGNLYEDDPNKKPKQKSMGIVLKRRDNAQIVKKVYGGVIDIMLNKQNMKASVDFLREQLRDLVDGKYPLEDLIITKTLRAEYKDPTKIAHKVLAERMGERDPGNKPMVNERIPFVYIKPPPGVEVKLQGDRIEHPDYIREQNLTPDYRFYITNQLLKPICQLYALCVEQLPEYSEADDYWEQVEAALLEKPLYMDEKKRKDRVQALRMRMVEELLFHPYIAELDLRDGVEPKKPRKAASTKEPGKKKRSPSIVERPAEDCKYHMQVDVKQIKLGKEYEYHVTVCIPSTNTTTYQETLREKGNKQESFAKAIQAVIMTMTEKDPATIASFREDGLRVRADKTFIKGWKQAIQKRDTLYAEVENILAMRDIGKLKELHEMQRLAKLAKVHEELNCTLEEI